MSGPVRATRDEDAAARSALGALGYAVDDIQALARDQRAFARRTPRRDEHLAPGVRFEARSLELGEGCFTNVYTLRLRLDAVRVEADSRASGFALRERCAAGGALAAVSGSFGFISDDPAYQPAEPCLDFCCRAGEILSLPTVAKPAFLRHRGRPSVRVLEAEGTLLLGDEPYRWTGSKATGPGPHRATDTVTVFGAANCRVRYADDARTGFLRHVERTANRTPPDAAAVDCVVARSPGTGLYVRSLHPGGGADLFAGNLVLRIPADRARAARPGTRVRVTEIDGVPAHALASGLSLGPSVADVTAGRTAGYDESLGVSPFRDVRHARTLLWLSGGELCFRVCDGAPLTETFQGVTPAEVARSCAAEGIDPRTVHHLDGGQSSKIALRRADGVEVVGNLHYLKWPRSHRDRFRWRGLDGRLLNSCFTVRCGRETAGARNDSDTEVGS